MTGAKLKQLLRGSTTRIACARVVCVSAVHPDDADGVAIQSEMTPEDQRATGKRFHTFEVPASEIAGLITGIRKARKASLNIRKRMPEGLRIVAAAVKRGERVWTGTRHADIIRVVFGETGQRVTQDEQGFVDNTGWFSNRFQAGAIAFQAGQTKDRKQTLLSEDLW